MRSAISRVVIFRVVMRAVSEENDPGVVIAAKADVLPRDVVGHDPLQTLSFISPSPWRRGQTLPREADPKHSAASFSLPSMAMRSGMDSISSVSFGVSSRRIFPAVVFGRPEVATASRHHQEVRGPHL